MAKEMQELEEESNRGTLETGLGSLHLQGTPLITLEVSRALGSSSQHRWRFAEALKSGDSGGSSEDRLFLVRWE